MILIFNKLNFYLNNINLFTKSYKNFIKHNFIYKF